MSSHPTLELDITNAVLTEWAQIPTETRQNLVESLSRKVGMLLWKKGGTTPYYCSCFWYGVSNKRM